MSRLSDFLHRTPPPPPIEYLIGPIEAAEFLRVPIDTVFYWAMAQLIPAHQLRHNGQTAWRFKRSELSEWCKQNPDLASPKGQRKLPTRKHKASVNQKKRTAPQATPDREEKIS